MVEYWAVGCLGSHEKQRDLTTLKITLFHIISLGAYDEDTAREKYPTEVQVQRCAL